MTGVVILVLATTLAVAFGLHRQRTDGRFAPAPEVEEVAQRTPEVEEVAQRTPEVEEVAQRTPEVEEVAQRPSRDPVTSPPHPTTWSSVATAVPDASPGEHATLVQFSSAFCAPCRTTRVLLADVASATDGVAHVEVDAEEHLALVRELGIRRTPTTLILDRSGRELTRAAGAPRREQVLAALPSRS